MRILLGRVKGDKGERGAQGPRGPRGERGPQGPPGEPGQTDIYTRAESDARYELKGESIDFQELARRIPTWQWKVTLPKSANQTVTATVGNTSYSETFYAQQGSRVGITVKSDPGYVPGKLSHTDLTLAGDVAVTVTAATESEEVETGTFVARAGRNSTFEVPPKVHTLKITAGGIVKFCHVKPQATVKIVPFGPTFDESWYPDLLHIEPVPKGDPIIVPIVDGTGFKTIFGIEKIEGNITIEWSQEINEHAADFDLTKYLF